MGEVDVDGMLERITPAQLREWQAEFALRADEREERERIARLVRHNESLLRRHRRR